MKKWIIIGITVVVLACMTIAYFMLTAAQTNQGTANQKTAKAPEGEFGNPCSVLKKADIEAAFGIPFKSGKEEGGAPAPRDASLTSCKYDQQTDGSATALLRATTFSIDVETHANTDDAKASIEATKSTTTVGGKVYFVKTDVPGIGDEAFFFTGQANGVQNTEEYMYARKGNQVLHFIAIKISGIDHAKAQEAIKTLAKKALD